jgi:expansin (peptidoglycan-binding protein)
VHSLTMGSSRVWGGLVLTVVAGCSSGASSSTTAVSDGPDASASSGSGHGSGRGASSGESSGAASSGNVSSGAASSGGASTGSGMVDSSVPVDTTDGGIVTYGSPYTGGQYNLGPVDYTETQFHNACAPSTKYPASVQQAEGSLLAGLWNGVANVADYCDACIYVTTAKGKSATLRVVTYGDTSTNSIDVSPSAYQVLNAGEYPRGMTWQFAKCPDTGVVSYEFQTGSSEYWTSFWVRNARIPLRSVEVKSLNHDYKALARGTDGTLTDGGGFGKGTFSIRLTGLDGQQVIDTFAWPAAGIAGQMLNGQGNFH